MPKNIVVLSDGTGQVGGKGAERNTNVYKLFTMLEDRTPRQVVFYDPGLGTGLRKLTGNVAGAGISTNVKQAYRFIFDNYEDGDRLFLIGFSRGATTVRSLAGFIDHFGIIPRSRPDLINRAYKIYQTRPPFFKSAAKRQRAKILASVKGGDGHPGVEEKTESAQLLRAPLDDPKRRVEWFIALARQRKEAAEKRARKSSEAFLERLLDQELVHVADEEKDHRGQAAGADEGKRAKSFVKGYKLGLKAREFLKANYTYHTEIEFLGCFDTVAALYRIPGLQYQFHDLRLTWSVKHAYHALAIDEMRKAFLPALFAKKSEHQTVQEVWFSGVHTDVGGGYPERGLAEISLGWMLRKAHNHGILLDPGNVTLSEDPDALLNNSRGGFVTQIYPKAVRLGSNGNLNHVTAEPVIHESVFIRARSGHFEELVKEKLWTKALRLGAQDKAPDDSKTRAERYAQRLGDILGVEDAGKTYDDFLALRARLEAGERLNSEERDRFRRIEEWVPYDPVLLTEQEERWMARVEQTSKESPKHSSTTRQRILTWLNGSLAGTALDRSACIRVWNLKTGDQVRGITGHAGVVAVAVNSDRILSGSMDHTVKVWELATGKELQTLAGHDGEVLGVAVTSDGTRGVSASADKTLKLWNLDDGKEERTFGGRYGHTGEVLAVAITADGTRVVSASADKTVKVWNLHSGMHELTLEGHTGEVLAVAVGSDRIVSGSADETVRVWDLQTGKEVYLLRGKGKAGKVLGVAVSPDGSRIVSAHTDATMNVWSSTGEHQLTLIGHMGSVAGVALTSDRILSASNDNTVKVWDLQDGRELRTFVGHADAVLGVAVTPNGDHVVSAALESSVLKRLTASGRVVGPGQSTRAERRYYRRLAEEVVSYDSNTALIVADVQHDFAHPDGSLYVPGGEEVIPIINNEIKRAKESNAPVFYTRDWHNPDSPHFISGGGVWPKHCVGGEEGAGFADNLIQPESDYFEIKKGSNDEDGYSGFSMRHLRTKKDGPTELKERLEENNVKRVVITGLALDYTVKHTALDAAKHFDAVLLLDATRAINEEDGKRALAELAQAGVEMQKSEPLEGIAHKD